MTKTENQAKQSKAIELAKRGLQQKQIAVEIGATEKTVGNWLKDWKAEQRTRNSNIKLFEVQLTKLLKSDKPDILDIVRLTKALNEYKKG